MARAKRQSEQTEAAVEAMQEEVPTFVLRADQKGHLRALLAALQELPDHEAAQGLRVLREFDLYEENHRG